MTDETTDLPPAGAPVEAPQPEQPPAAPVEGAAAADAPETSAASSEDGKAKGGDRRFAVLTAKAAYDRQRAEAAEAALEELKARLSLLEAGKPAADGDAPERPKPSVPPSHDDVEARAAALLAQREVEGRRVAVIQEGEKTFGKDGWKEKTDTLTDLGAFRTPDFLHALIELPNGAQIAASLADDPERLTALLGKRPTAMAAELGRMSAEIAAPKAKALSAAPAPVQPLATRGSPAPADIYDPKMSMKEFIALRNKTAPPTLGGPRRRSA